MERWTIHYFELAGSRQDSSDLERHKAGERYWKSSQAVEADAQARMADWQNHVPANKIGKKEKIQRAAAERSIQQWKRQELTPDPAARRAMRSTSVAQAQGGISLLEALPNVEIARIRRSPINL